MPPLDESLEFSVRRGNVRLEVSRPQGMVRLVGKERSAIYSLREEPNPRAGLPMSSGWLVQAKARTFVRVDARRLQGLGGAQEGLRSRLLEAWRELGEEEDRQFLYEVLPSRNRLGGSFQGSSLSALKGPAWQGQETWQLTYASRVMGSGVIALPVGWKYYQRAYAPGPGLVLNSQNSERPAGSAPDEALFGNIELTDFKLEHFAADHFRPPVGYRERYSDAELQQDTPRTPFYRHVPRDYGQIGTTGYTQERWNERRITLIREEYLQKNSRLRQWMFEIFVYLLDKPEEVVPFAEFLRMDWLGFKSWDARPLAPEATATLKSGFLLRKKNRLIRLDLKYFKRGAPGQHSAEQEPEARQELQTLARELSERLP
ncbi:MAG: hypothetical protein KF760_34695 [Candidatus Eremiobacteraeota bacterium]|nr:hypothetical protein [Candidatus Eremiobacteraeota bacterium]MCW5868414.1 hypothetical protein [Candidatus Eremiobacteraeota bacterium]